ncbi:MAG: PorV/PorQ family protein [Bacteroidota bacterium]
MIKRILFTLIVLTFPETGYGGGFSKVGTAAAQFLKIGVGARATGMGETFVAVANDASALYWNPSGMTNSTDMSVNVSHTQWFAELFHNYAGIVIPFGENDFIGVSAISLTTHEQEVTTVEQPDGAGIFYTVNDIAIGLSYARSLTDRFSVGITAKYIQQDAYNESANTLAMDVGTYLRTGFHNLIIGMCVSNFGGNMQLEGRDLIALADINKQISGEYNPDSRLKTEPWSLPLNFRVGIAMDIVGGSDPFFESESHRFIMALDGNHPNDNNERINVGGEYSWNETVYARFGYKINYDIEKLTYGIGVKMHVGTQQIGFDYALVDYHDLGTVSRLSVELGF